MNGAGNHSTSERERTLQVSHREALTLLSALEISPFEDEVLTQKVLNVVYGQRQEPAHPAVRPRGSRDFNHHRR